MNVSPDFSLPIRTVSLYFVGGILFYIAAMASLIGADPSAALNDYRILGWVHLYLVGFVMMSIIGAMGQMSVVVGEVYHAYPNVFKAIFPLQAAGTILLVWGIYAHPVWMVAGGGVLLAALGLFAFDLFFTLRRSRRRTAIIRSMQWSTFFLVLGTLIGIAMAAGYAGWLGIDPSSWRNVHVFVLVGGYVMINIMGVSTVLLPMFGACERPGDNEYATSFATMSGAVTLAVASMAVPMLLSVAIVLGIGSVAYYMVRVYRIFTSKKRPYSDIWERSVAAAFGSLLVSLVAFAYGIVAQDVLGIKLGFWFFAAGFLGFLISGHLYKIVPFLVWFERFAPRIEEEAVPMVHELLPRRWPQLQWSLGLIGVVGMGGAIALGHSGAAAVCAVILALAGSVLLMAVIQILTFKGKT